MSLRTRLILFVCLMMMVILGSTAILIIRVRSKEIEDELIIRDNLRSENLVPVLVTEMGTYYSFQFDVYSSIVREAMKSDSNILYLRILNTNGQVLFDVSELNGGKYDKSSVRNETAPYILKAIVSKKITQDFIMQDNQREIRILTPYIDNYGVYRAMVEFHFSTSEIDTAVNQMILYFSGLFGVFLIFGIVITMILARQITKPINNLTRGAEELEKGNFGVKVEVKSRDELGKLAMVFNKMAETIFQSQKKLADYNKELEQKVSGRTKELEDKNVELNRINSFMVGREMKMVELKEEISKLKEEK